jgi:hypothetical protein
MQRALVGTFMGGLKMDISNGIRMFKLRTLKEVISLARMKDDQLERQRRGVRPPNLMRAPLTFASASQTAPPASIVSVRRLTWDEMQRRRAQNLCFNCNGCFTVGHKCQGPRVLMLEVYDGSNNFLADNGNEELTSEENQEEMVTPKITLHALTWWTVPKTMRISAKIGSHHVLY